MLLIMIACFSTVLFLCQCSLFLLILKLVPPGKNKINTAVLLTFYLDTDVLQQYREGMGVWCMGGGGGLL